ncbi:antibiotic biosynthesis monooxygenase [Bacillus timonensis]|nr:antibiotic biosynthesis monooxygenase [Bacillus timonensis]
MNKFGLYGKLVAVPGMRDTLANILLDAANSLKKVEDCELYVVNTSEDEPDAVFVFEVWKSEDAHHASLSLESTQTLIEKAKPILAGIERINTVVPIGGKF